MTAGSAAPLSEPWQQLHPRGAAPPFTGASMTFDGEDGYLLLFGANCSVACPAGPGFTWAYANGSWTNLSANLTRAPADRESAQMAYDAVDGYVVLFGGFSNLNGSTFDDTWTFRAGQWTPLDPGTRPPARSAGSFVWDPVDNYTLLFGGAQPGVGYYGDTWRFVHGNWSELSPGAHPNARYEQAMAWDDGNQYGVLFGGYGPTAPFDSAFNDTWAFSAGIWTNVSATAGTPPGRLLDAEFAYDATARYLLAYGGLAAPSFAASTETFAFVNGTWSALRTLPGGPGPQAAAPMAAYPPCLCVLLLANPNGSMFLYPRFAVTATAFPPVADAGEPVTFNSSILGGFPGYSFLWRFSDGSTAVPRDAVHAYAVAGSYEADLTVVDSTGQSTNASVNVTILGGLALTARSNVTATDVGMPVSFTASASGGSGAAQVTWSFGDSGSSSGPSAVHTYSTAAAERVVARAVDSVGGSVEENWTIQVSDRPAAISLTVSKATSEVGMPTSFDLTTVGGTAPLTYEWTGLPPGCAAANAPDLECRPTAAGAYSLDVSVRDSVGATASRSADGLVNSPPAAALVFATSTVPVGGEARIRVIVENGTAPFSYQYSHLPSGCPTGGSAWLNCTPNASGTYPVSVLVTDADGVSAIATGNLTVVAPIRAPPVAWVPVLTGLGVALLLGGLGAGGFLLRRRWRSTPGGPPPPAE